MKYNEKLSNRVKEALAHLPQVEEKKMFGGLAFMVNDKLCICVGDDEILFRIDPALHAGDVMKNGCRTMLMKGKPCKGYVYVKEEMLNTKKEFDCWTELALAFNNEAKASPKKKKKA